MATTETAWRDLRAALEGEVVLPGSPRYDEVRSPQIPRFHDVRPQAVVLCRTPEDVVEAISFARRSGIEVAVRSGGHDFAGRSSGPGMVLDLRPMHSLEVSDGLATVGPGFRLGDLYAALAQHEVTIPAGCGATVGIGGQALGGGLGLLGRSRGLTSDQLVVAEVVLADGRVVECDEERHEDLFWALRGAGAQGLGVVTRLTLRTVPEPAATSFHLKWRYERASALIAAWQEWSPTGPDELAASLLVTVGGEAGADPVVHLFGSMIDSETATAALLDEFVSVSGADAASPERAYMRYGSLKNYLAERGPGDQEDEDGRPYMKSEFFREPLPAGAVEALVELFVRGRRPGEARKLDFMPWGGAYNRVPANATAFPHRKELFLLEHSVVVPAGFDSAATEAARAWLSDSWKLVHPSGSGGVYANFPDTDLPDEHRAYWGANLERVRRVKERYDPERVFG
ncbi:MAG TPA: FAD-binding oxidoreductase [Gaiellaceae bacterium]|nr:FAD-binding oxidoreductase [Gaiellaceae bacterium]